MKRRMISSRVNGAQLPLSVKNVSKKHFISRKPSMIDPFGIEEKIPKHCKGKVKSYSILDPIYMAFNQQRLNQLGSGAAAEFIASLDFNRSSQMNELRKKCSDEDLHYMIKSRHLQNPCEIAAWAELQLENMDKFTSEVARIQAERQAQFDAENKDKQEIIE